MKVSAPTLVLMIKYFTILIFSSFCYQVLAADTNVPSTSQMEVIEVTAQKRVQSVQDVPMSLHALSSTAFDAFQINQASEVATLVPNVNSTRSISGTSNYYIRGVGMDGFNLSSVAAVGLYVDDVAIFNPMLANFTLFDIQRVEVLKGPQNTLFGKNTTGGAINFISNSPELHEKSGYGQVTLGNYHQRELDAAINLPANDHLNVRLSGFSHKRDGTVSSVIAGNNSDYNNTNHFGAKVQMAYQFNDHLAILASLYGGKQNQIAEVKTAMSPLDGQQVIQLDNQDLSKNHSSLLNPRNDIEALGGFLKITSTQNHYRFNAITSFEQVNSQRMDDWGSQHLPSAVYQSITYSATDTQSIAQELQWQSPIGNDIHWLVGLLYNKEKGDLLQAALIDPGGEGRPDDSIPDAGIGPMFDRGAWVEHSNQTFSAYGQMTYPVTPALNVTSGFRWTKQQLTPTVNAAGMMMDLPGQAFPLGSLGWYSLGNNDFDSQSDFMGFERAKNFLVANGGFPASADIDESFNEWGGKIALDYHVQPNVMIYSSVSRGFKMGAVNSNPTTAAFQSLLSSVVKPETLTTAEVGFKTDLLNNTFRMNGAIFKNIWHDYQFFLVYNPGNPAQLFASLVNLPEATSTGAELEMHWNASSTLKVNLGIGWLDTKVTDGELNTNGVPAQIIDGFQAQVSKGNKLTNAPEWNYNFAVSKQFTFDESDFTLNIHYHFVDEHIHQLAGNNSDNWVKNFSEKAVGITTLNGLYEFGEHREYQVSLWVKNVTDKRYCSERAIAPGTSPETVRLCVQNDPRAFGVTAKMVF